MPMKTLTVTVMLIAGVSSTGAPAYADHDGRNVYYISGRDSVPFRAPATDPTARTRLKVGSTRHSVLSVVPSPDGKYLLQTIRAGIPSGVGYRVLVTDRDGSHRRVVWSRDNGKAYHFYHRWLLPGTTWAPDGKRVYFTSVDVATDGVHPDTPDVTTTLLRTAPISATGLPGPVTQVPGGEGLRWPTVDPTGGTIAGVRRDSGECEWTSTSSTTSTIVLLDLSTGTTHDLLTLTSTVEACARPMQHLAWSPDGTRIAFDRQKCCHFLRGRASYWTGEIDCVAVDGRDGDSPRVMVLPGGHLVANPTWRNARVLWYTRQDKDRGDRDDDPRTLTDLFSVVDQDRQAGVPVRRTHTPKRPENAPSFG